MKRNERFEICFREYRNLMMRIVMDRTGDYQAAQEICQHVFMMFYKNMDKVAPGMAKAWLIRCTQNACIDYLRNSMVRKEVLSDISLSEAGNILPSESSDPCEESVINQELAGEILRDVREVNERWYEVLMLHCIQGMTHEEAAEALHISRTVLRARLYRARAYVRKHYGKDYLD